MFFGGPCFSIVEEVLLEKNGNSVKFFLTFWQTAKDAVNLEGFSQKFFAAKIAMIFDDVQIRRLRMPIFQESKHIVAENECMVF